VQNAKRAAQRAKQKDREKAAKGAAEERSEAGPAGCSNADVAEDEIARAALEAARISDRWALLLFCQTWHHAWRMIVTPWSKDAK
jgi:hypothetical protein